MTLNEALLLIRKAKAVYVLCVLTPDDDIYFQVWNTLSPSIRPKTAICVCG